MLLGVAVGAIAAFAIVLVVSLLPVFDGEGSDASAAANQTTAAPQQATATQDTVTGQGQGNSQGQAQGQGQGGGQGQGPPEGRGPGSQGNAAEDADPLSFGLASSEVVDAFTTPGCIVCHSIKGVGGGNATIGPHLYRLGVVAVDRRPGASVEAYITESILDPNAFIMPNCPTGDCLPGIMPQTYSESLSAADLETIVNYLAVLGTAAEADVLTQP